MPETPIHSLSIAGHIYETEDVHAANDYISAHVTDHRLDVLSRESRIAFRCRRWGVGGLQVCDFSYGRAEVEIRLERSPLPVFFLVLPLAGHATIFRRDDRFVLSPGMAMLFSTTVDKGARFRDSKDFRNLNFRLGAGSVNEFLSREFGQPLTEEIKFGDQPVAVSAGLRHMIDCAQSIASRLDEPHSCKLYAGRHVARHTHDLLLSLLISSVPNNYMEAYRSPSIRSAAPRYIIRAEEYMRSHMADPLTMTDVAAAVGVAARTLQCGFRRYRNYTAEQFLRDERLTVVRTALMNGRERNLSVADIAFEYGFSHLGRFASAYLRRFGEKPSETLRKGG